MVETGGPHQSRKSRRFFRTAVIIGSLVALAAIYGPAIGKAKARGERRRCVENLKRLAVASIMYLNDASVTAPATILSITNSVENAKLFICPSDKSRVTVDSFSELSGKGSSYHANMSLAGKMMPLSEAQNHILIRCSIHDNVALADGSVHILTPRGMSNLISANRRP